MRVKTMSKIVLTEEEKSNLEKTAKIVEEISNIIECMPGFLCRQEAMPSTIYCNTIKQNIFKLLDCTNVLSNEVEEEIDWSKVPINTPILVRNDEDHEWKIRNFAGYIDNKVCAYNVRFYKGMPLNCACGKVSWKYAKLKTTEE